MKMKQKKRKFNQIIKSINFSSIYFSNINYSGSFHFHTPKKEEREYEIECTQLVCTHQLRIYTHINRYIIYNMLYIYRHFHQSKHI